MVLQQIQNHPKSSYTISKPSEPWTGYSTGQIRMIGNNLERRNSK